MLVFNIDSALLNSQEHKVAQFGVHRPNLLSLPPPLSLQNYLLSAHQTINLLQSTLQTM